MTTSAQTTRLVPVTWGLRFGLFCFVAGWIYLLGFGPAVVLSMPTKYAGYERPVRFPCLASTVSVAYSPLFEVLVGHAGSLPRNALQRYVHFCDYGAPPWEKASKEDDKKLEADIKRTVEALRERRVKEGH
jgi:hypothetical protein